MTCPVCVSPLIRVAALLAACAASAVPAIAADLPGTFRWTEPNDSGTVDLQYDGKPVLRYMYAFDRSSPARIAETFKVYHHVFGPGTGALLTKGPGGLYTHHRGLFVGWRRTRYEGREIDTWHCTNGVHQRHVRFVDRKAGGESGSMCSEIAWNESNGKPVISEIRRVRVTRAAGTEAAPTAWQIDWTSRLTSLRGPIELEGDRQHAGFQYRAAQSVAESNSAAYVRPKGFPSQSKAFEVDDSGDPPRHIDLGWLAMSYNVDSKPYTVAYFEDPALPKPSLFSERPYGRFGAYFKTTLVPGHPLTLRYRLIVSAGIPPSRDTLQADFEKFVANVVNWPSPTAEE